MQISIDALRARLDAIAACGLLSSGEIEDIVSVFDASFPCAAALGRAESVHLHVRVDDLDALRPSLDALGTAENEKVGYVKLRSPDGVHLIVSSIEIADDDRVPTLPRRTRPHLDHVGIDLRDVSESARTLFDAIPAQVTAASWRTAHQGGPDTAVFCCHTSVAEKHWVYPPASAGLRTPVEIAFGPLRIGEGMGCDLRPMDPELAEEHVAVAPCCAPPRRAAVTLGRKPT